MPILPIYEVPHPILKQKAARVEVVDDEIRKLIADMAETMYAAPGVGLAAPQVGVSKRVLVADVPVGADGVADAGDDSRPESRGADLLALVNPEIVESRGETRYDEGCLSVPDFVEPLKRSAEIVVTGQDREGASVRIVARGFYAVVLQHEIDHLDGVTILDRVSKLKRSLYQSRRARAKARGDSKAAEHRPGAI
ncbi:peptide deformylase [Myxococcota bacterium]|nr:peptide deformylase [Myxococcota bacterium]